MKKLLFLISVGLFLFVIKAPAFAGDFSLPQKNYSIQIASGKEQVEQVLISNSSAKEQTINLSWQGYTLPADQIISSQFLTIHNLDFASPEVSQITLQPYAVGSVAVVFKTPDSLKPGDYYGSLVLKNGTTSTQASFNALFAGALVEDTKVSDTSTENKKLKVILENTGNIATKTKLEILVTDFFGKKVVAVESNEYDLKAGQKLTQSFPLKNLLPGFYRAQIKLISGRADTAQTKLYFFNYQVWLIWLVGLIVLIGTVLLVRKFVRKKKNV
ncbi:MAG TPA: hypothetical protein VLE47_00725 [Candidatus Saccharimonadales bacterium]|nr:hypothetical protein [Candidatus Saccharimonadales bacterium]